MKLIRFSVISLCFLLTACAFHSGADDTEWFDLGIGAARNRAGDIPLRAWRLEVRSDTDLSDNAMRYRLEYIKPVGMARVLSYSRSRWALPPAEILRRRLSGYLFWAGDANDQCSLTLNLTRFEQIFSTPEKSYGVIAVEARLLNTVTGVLEDEEIFIRKVPAPTPDAVGGVEALAEGASLLASEDLWKWREAGKTGRQRGCWQSNDPKVTKQR